MKRFKLLLIILLFAVSSAGAELAEIGVNPFDLEVGARPLAMGGAYVGRADDVNTILYNPGGMAWARGISLTVSDFDNITAVQAYPTGYGSSIGLAIATSKLTAIPAAGGPANFSSNILVLSYGSKLNAIPALRNKELFQQIGVGISFKNIMGQTLRRTGQTDRSATGWDLDLGALWKRSEWWWFGLSAQNLFGGSMLWDNGTQEAIPSSFRLGTSARIIGDIGSPIFQEGRELLLGGELDFNSAFSNLIRLGAEYGINKTHFLRGGISNSHLNLGYGYRAGEWGLDLALYTEPVKNEGRFYFSVLYFPKEWILFKPLDVERPAVLLEKAFERISLEDNITTYEDRLDISGKVKPGVEVYVNGLRAYIAEDNAFNVNIPLAIGKNLVLVEARFEGEKKVWKYKVLRKAKVQLAEEKAVKLALEKTVTPEAREALKLKERELAKSREKVEELVTVGVIEITPEAEFKLDASVTRGELSAWVVKASGLPVPKVQRDIFSDVKRDNPLAPYIKVVVDWDVLRPFADNTFRPEAPVSKEEGEKIFKVFGLKK